MSDLGLGNLVTLKRHLLPAKLVPGTDFDAIITDLGKGVALSFDRLCNRNFARLAGATETFSADRDHWHLRRYPLEGVSEVALRTDLTAGWVVQTGAIQNQDEASGLIYFGAERGVFAGSYRVTYTGGYWYDTSEDESGALPSGATRVPDDLKIAWLLQCGALWENSDTAKKQMGAEPGKWSTLTKADLAPAVREILNGFIRYQMT